jgi:hypothetical protein
MVVRDVAEAIRLVGQAIDHTRTIVEAVNDGRKYLEKFHPDAKKDLTALLNEMSKTLEGLAEVAGVITGFQFTAEGPGRELEPARFNRYVVQKEQKAKRLRAHRGDLKGSCEKIRRHRQALDDRAGEPWSGWALVLGEKRKQRRAKLSSDLNQLYADDQQIIFLIENLMRAADLALDDVRAALGSRTKAYPENVPRAADVLEEHATRFKPIHDECSDLAADLRQTIKLMG